MALAVNGSGTIFKKCDSTNHRPDSNKGCASSTCQHTCDPPERRQHAWTLRHWISGKKLARARSRNGSGGSDAGHRTEEARDEKDSDAAEDEYPKQVLRQGRGEDTADRQDGTACPGQGRSSLVGRFEGCITAHRGRRPYPRGRAARYPPC